MESGQSALIAGFTVGGALPRRVLIRAVGPTLGDFGVGGTLPDPVLRVFHSGTIVAENDNWSATDALREATQSVSAFALRNGGLDAAAIVSLPPGSYTAQVSGVDGATGVALLEVYELP